MRPTLELDAQELTAASRMILTIIEDEDMDRGTAFGSCFLVALWLYNQGPLEENLDRDFNLLEQFYQWLAAVSVDSTHH